MFRYNQPDVEAFVPAQLKAAGPNTYAFLDAQQFVETGGGEYHLARLRLLRVEADMAYPRRELGVDAGD